MREDRSDADLLEQRHGEHRDPLARADPPHPLVRLRFNGDGRVAAHERAGEVLAPVVQIAREPGLLDDHRDVGAHEAETRLDHAQVRALEQIEGIGPPPPGTCGLAGSACSPLSGPTATGRPIPGRAATEPANPGSAAESPAPAITARKRFRRAPFTRSAVWSGCRWAEDTWSSYETPALL